MNQRHPVGVPDPLEPVAPVTSLGVLDVPELDAELLEVGRGIERLQIALLALVAVGVGILVARGRG